MHTLQFIREVWRAPCYRTSPFAIARYAYAKWVLSRSRQNDPEKFLEDLGIRRDLALRDFQRWRPELEYALRSVEEVPEGQGGISAADGIVLYGLVRALDPDNVIETGVAAGVSTCYIGAALIENGHGTLFSVELPPDGIPDVRTQDGSCYTWKARGVGWAVPESVRKSLGDRHRVVLGDVRKVLPNLLKKLPYVDIFFHDDLHTPQHMSWEYRLVWPHIRPGGWLVSDDSNYGWINFCTNLGREERGFLNLDRLTALQKSNQNEL